MTEPIVTREMIEKKALAAILAGNPINPFPPLSAAYKTWEETVVTLRWIAETEHAA